MRKYLKIIIPIIGIALLGFLGFNVISKIQYKKEVAEAIQDLPAFSFQTLTGNTFTQEDIKMKEPVVFIYFNTECDYCQHEAVEIKKHQEALKDIQVIFVSSEEPEVIGDFAMKYKLKAYDNIHFLFDKRADFAKTFDATSIPYILIYNQDQELVAKRKGQTKVSFILEALQNDGNV